VEGARLEALDGVCPLVEAHAHEVQNDAEEKDFEVFLLFISKIVLEESADD